MRIALKHPELPRFKYMLAEAPIDLDLASFLCERAVQYRNDVQPTPGRRAIAEASIRYIQVSNPGVDVFECF